MNFLQCPAISVLNNSTALLNLYFYWFRLPAGSSVIGFVLYHPLFSLFIPDYVERYRVYPLWTACSFYCYNRFASQLHGHACKLKRAVLNEIFMNTTSRNGSARHSNLLQRVLSAKRYKMELTKISISAGGKTPYKSHWSRIIKKLHKPWRVQHLSFLYWRHKTDKLSVNIVSRPKR